MIKHLDGVHETVDYRAEDNHVCLYYNCENENYPMHWHNNFEIIMPVVNTYRVICCGEDYQLRKGDILIISPCVLHELYAPPTGERIIFQPSFPQSSNMSELNHLVSAIRPALLITPETHPEVYKDIQQLLFDIKEEYFSSSPYSETMIYSKFLEMLVEIGRGKNVQQSTTDHSGIQRQQEYRDKFMYITDYIDTHYAEDLSLEKMASIAGFSKYYFAKLFKQYTDTSFYKYLNRRRIEHAEAELIESQTPVTEIALQSGFSSLSAFLRMFKQLAKCTPTEFRNMYNES